MLERCSTTSCAMSITRWRSSLGGIRRRITGSSTHRSRATAIAWIVWESKTSPPKSRASETAETRGCTFEESGEGTRIAPFKYALVGHSRRASMLSMTTWMS